MHRNTQNEHTPNFNGRLFKGGEVGHQVAEKQCWITLKVLQKENTRYDNSTFSPVP